MNIQPNQEINNHFIGSSVDKQALLKNIHQQLSKSGYCLIRGLDTNLDQFGQLVGDLCSSVTFDPARHSSADNTQKVDAGTDEIGLHIENGNTLKVPEMVAFYCEQAPRSGSQTTVCDGRTLLQSMPSMYRDLFSQPLIVSRRVAAPLWKQYLINEHPLLNTMEEVKFKHLETVLLNFSGASAVLCDAESIQFSITIDPIRQSTISGDQAFANAIMGPSFNYEKPSYRFSDGSSISDDLIDELRILAETATHEITWADNDIVFLDNTRVMHGRRKILDATHRKLYIGMGDL